MHDTRTARRTRSYQTHGIVLRRIRLGEADRIVTVLTMEFGKRRFVSKSSRKPGSRSAGHLEPYTRTRLQIAETRGLHIITQAESEETFAALKADELAIGYAALMAELVDTMCEEDERNPQVYELLAMCLRLIDQGQSPLRTLLIFQINLLRLQGYQPDLYECVVCGRVLTAGGNGFSVDGGVVCSTCLPTTGSARPLSDNAIKLARILAGGEAGQVFRLNTSDSLLESLDEALTRYTAHITGKGSQARMVLWSLQLQSNASQVHHE